MLKKISALIILISLVILVGCSGGQVSDKIPSLPGEKKVMPPDVYVPKGETPEDYLNRYYKLYVAKKFDESYKMLPASKRANQTVQQYKEANGSFETESFSLGQKVTKGDTTVIDVKLKLKQYGTWTSSWQFVKNSKGIVVQDYAASGSTKK